MGIEEFVSMLSPDKYDFTNDVANSRYIMLDNYEKYFVYMAIAKPYKQSKENIMKLGADFSIKCKEIYKKIIDPDSESELLQKIYSLLWEEEHLDFCMKGERIKGETMNSHNTTMSELYEILETVLHKQERESIKTEKGGFQNISTRYILSRYVENPIGHQELFNKVEGMRYFLSIYHTLGNFIPVPVGCNGPRGTGKLKDYWDLTLKVIYDYYIYDIDNIKDIVGEKNSGMYRRWLDSYQKMNSKTNSWKNFVEKNYLQDFVNYNDEDSSYGKPKELWKNHFDGEVLPKDRDQIEQFYVNASSFITARSVRMLQRLWHLLYVKVEG